jgi:very-short-patch-repair endonuclease
MLPSMRARIKIPVTRGQVVAPEKVRFAKALRRHMTSEERLLWNKLRRSAVEGIHFRRQQIIGGYIADFYCAAANLAIELDGPVHDGQTVADRERDAALSELGIGTMRISNEELAADFGLVVRKIVAACRTTSPLQT